MKVTVHHFKFYDVNADEEIIPRRKSTEARITSILGAVIIPGTAEQVEISRLDEYGRYDPEATDA